MRRAIAILVVAVAFILVGPLLTTPHAKTAGVPFEFAPPEGFTRSPNKAAEVWTFVDPTPGPRAPQPPSAVVTHSEKTMSVEERDLAKLVDDMASVFPACTWVHRRHELRARSDGARVGLVEGDCDHEMDLSAFGLPSKTIKTRKVQLLFPDDTGTSIITGSYPTEQAARWEPLFEATIGQSKGVATRVPPPPSWMYGVWGAAGVVIGWLVSALSQKRAASRPAGTT